MEMPVIAYHKIKPLRQAKGLRQGEMAMELGISRPTYVLMERGEREPTLTQLYTLARLLGVKVDELCSVLDNYKPVASDYAKFKELVGTCIAFGAEQETITKTKLGKLAYLADFAWYYLAKRPMTGVLYRATAKGPVADDYLRAVDELYEEEAITIESRGAALIIRSLEQQPNKLLSQPELDLIHAICTKWRFESTESIIGFTRNQSPWESSRLGDLMPYESILAEPKESLY